MTAPDTFPFRSHLDEFSEAKLTMAAQPMHYRSVFGHAVLNEYCRQWLQTDVENARLEWRYRVYYRLRPWIPLKLRQRLQQSFSAPTNDQWYIPQSFLQGLVAQLEQVSKPVYLIHPWPDDARFAFVLTHDVESAEGFRNMLPIADMEESLGFRSSWYLIPYKYKIDHGVVRELKQRGFDVGIHGYNHDGRLFTSRRLFDARLGAINQALARFDCAGFRAPMVHRDLEWMQDLDAEYDTSCFDVDPFQAMPGGIGSIWPCIVGKLVELPYTLPQDHTLFVVLGQRDDRLWERKLELLRRCSGLALTLTHPDYMLTRLHRSIYERFLRTVRQHSDYWHALPRYVARWWRERDASWLDLTSQAEPTVCGPASQRGAVASLEVEFDEPRLRILRPARVASSADND